LYRLLMVINITGTLLLHIATYIWVSLITSALTNGLNATNYNMLSTSNTKAGAFCPCIPSLLYGFRNPPVSQNLFDMVEPTAAKTLTLITSGSSFLLRPIYCYNFSPVEKFNNWWRAVGKFVSIPHYFLLKLNVTCITIVNL